MNIFKLKAVILFGLLGVAFLLLGIYMAVFEEVPSLAGYDSLLTVEGIDRLMGIFPFGFGVLFCFKAKGEYEDIVDATK